MTSKLWPIVSLFFAAALIAPLTYIALAYHLDPLNLFGQSRDIYRDLNRDDRVRTALIIRSGSYNSVILGSSMLKRVNENTMSEGRYKYVNISTTGSTIHERTKYLEHILSFKKLQSVVFSMDHGLSLHRRNYPVNSDPDGWMYLFDASRVNDVLIYLEKDYVKCILEMVVADCSLRRMSAKKADKTYRDALKKERLIAGLDGWSSEKGRGRLVKSRVKRIVGGGTFVGEDTTDYYADLLRLKQLARDNRSVEFNFVIPPYSMAYLKLMYDYHNSMFSDYRNFLSDVYETFKDSSNVRVVFLDGNPLTEDLNNYIDMRHYIGPVIDTLISEVKGDSNLLHERFSHRFASIERRLDRYDASALMELYGEDSK
ncbi:hypothetical protein ACWCIB_11715 [SAR92 clade bacterium H246]